MLRGAFTFGTLWPTVAVANNENNENNEQKNENDKSSESID